MMDLKPLLYVYFVSSSMQATQVDQAKLSMRSQRFHESLGNQDFKKTFSWDDLLQTTVSKTL